MIIDRASTFSDAQIIETLKAKCVSVAIDQWYHRRQKDAEGEFYRKIAGQGPMKDFNSTTQGLYVCTADGKLLGFTNHRSPDRVKEILRKALADFQPAEVAPLEKPRHDPNLSSPPPEGGLVVTVTSKVLAGYSPPADGETRAFQESLGRDVLWVRKDEHQALARGQVPESLKVRLAKFNLIDNTRGEPSPWQPAEVRKIDLTLKDGAIAGTAHLETASGDRGFRAEIRGIVESKDGKVVRLDLVARGQAWGYSGCTEAASPKGRFTLAVALRLASGKDEADRVMPQGAKSWLPDYLR